MPWLGGQATIAHSTEAEEEGNSQKGLEEGTGSMASLSLQLRLWPHKCHRPIGRDDGAAIAR
jgi:hypothetical protein